MDLLRRISRALLLGGAGLCLLGVFGFVSGVFIQLPNAMVGLLTLAVPIASGGVLLASGALLGRAATRRAELRFSKTQVELRGGDADTTPT